MRKDCPHCRKSLEGSWIRWSKIQKTDHMRSCPICGKEIEHLIHPEEIAIRAIAIVVGIATMYWMNTRQHGFLVPLLVGTAILIGVYVAAQLRLRNAQRYRKGRHEA